MKVIKEQMQNERFDNLQQLQQHYKHHVVPSGKSDRNNSNGTYDYEFTPYEYADEQEYELAAEQFVLNSVPCGSELKWNNFTEPVGFLGKDGKIHLYSPSTGEFTVYTIENGEIITISYYLFTNRDRYMRDKQKFYKSEIPKGYNKQITKTNTHAK